MIEADQAPEAPPSAPEKEAGALAHTDTVPLTGLYPAPLSLNISQEMCFQCYLGNVSIEETLATLNITC